MGNTLQFNKKHLRWITAGLVMAQVILLAGWGTSTWLAVRPRVSGEVRAIDGVMTSHGVEFLNPQNVDKLLIGNDLFQAPRWEEIQNGKIEKFRNIDLVFKGTLRRRDGDVLAMIEDKGSGLFPFVRAGDSVQGGRVVKFNNDMAVWQKGDRRVELRLGQLVTVEKARVE